MLTVWCGHRASNQTRRGISASLCVSTAGIHPERSLPLGWQGQNLRGQRLPPVAGAPCKGWLFLRGPLGSAGEPSASTAIVFGAGAETTFSPTGRTSTEPLGASEESGGPLSIPSAKGVPRPKGLVGFQSWTLSPSAGPLPPPRDRPMSTVSGAKARRSQGWSQRAHLGLVRWVSRATPVGLGERGLSGGSRGSVTCA